MARESTYDAERDKLVRHLGNIVVDEKVSLEVSIRSYNGGPEKVAVQKFGWRRDNTRWTSGNIGRLTPQVALQLSELLAEAGGRESRGNTPVRRK